jgi:hypothetical protein
MGLLSLIVGRSDQHCTPVMTGLVPVIRVGRPPETRQLAGSGSAWMAGTSPAMTVHVQLMPNSRLNC